MKTLLAILKGIFSAAVQIAAVYFAGKQKEKADELQREKDAALDVAARIAGRADDAGELSDRFAARAANDDNHP